MVILPMIKRRWRTVVSIVAVAVAVGVVAYRASTVDPFAADAIHNPPFTPLTYSIQAFMWWDTYAASLHMSWARLMVFSDIKQTFAWKDIEPAQGQRDFTRADAIVDEIEQKGLRLIVRLTDTPDWAFPSLNGDLPPDVVDAPPDDPAAYADYCGAVASRYKGRIHAYQVWNEPNLAREWGGRVPDAAQYTALLKGCSTAIHTADPTAIVISAGLAPTGTHSPQATPDELFFQQLYDNRFQDWADVIGLHAPGFSPPSLTFEEAERQGIAHWATFRHIEDMRRLMVQNGDAAHQIAILEVGWTTDTKNPDYQWFAVTEEQQAQYLVEAYQYAAEHWRPWVGLMSVIYFARPDWTPADEQYWWAINTPELRIRPAFIALANMAKYCGERIVPERAPDSPEALGHVTVDPCR